MVRSVESSSGAELAVEAGTSSPRLGTTSPVPAKKARPAEKIERIIARQQIEGLPDTYQCIAGGKPVSRNESELQSSVPELLAAFLSAESNDEVPSSELDSSADDVQQLLTPAPRQARAGPASRTRMGPASRTGRDVITARRQVTVAESSSPDQLRLSAAKGKRRAESDEHDQTSEAATQPSSAVEEDEEDEFEVEDILEESEEDSFAEYESDDEPAPTKRAPGRPRGRPPNLRSQPTWRQQRPEREKRHANPTRQSTRTLQAGGKKSYGPLEEDSDWDDDEAMVLDDDSPPKPKRKLGRPRKQKRVQSDSSDDLDILSSTSVVKQPGRRANAARPANARRQMFIVDSDDDDDQDELEEAVEKGEVDEEVDEEEEWVDGIRPQHLHRSTCTKCGRLPTVELLDKFASKRARKQQARQPGRPRKRDEFDTDTDQEQDALEKLGAWFECAVCVEAYHFSCLHQDLRAEIRKGYVDAWKAANPNPAPAGMNQQQWEQAQARKGWRRKAKEELDPESTISMPRCWLCQKKNGRRCLGCGLLGKLKPAHPQPQPPTAPVDGDQPVAVGADGDVAIVDVEAAAEHEQGKDEGDKPNPPPVVEPGFMFRCKVCRRTCHFECLAPEEDDETLEERVISYEKDGRCHQCWRWRDELDHMLAWAPDDTVDHDGDEHEHAVVEGTRHKDDQPAPGEFTIPSSKDPTNTAEYLVKWKGRSYRQLEWVPHAFLCAKFSQKLTNFLATGSKVSFDPPPEGDEPEDDEPSAGRKEDLGSAPAPDPLAEERIPSAWKTVDRLLSVGFRPKREGDAPFVPKDISKTEHYKRKPEDSVRDVVQIYAKWTDLPYSESTLEAPPEEGEEGFDSFFAAYKKYLEAASPEMVVPTLPPHLIAKLNAPKPERTFPGLSTQPKMLTGGTLMDFQLKGVERLFYSWWEKKGIILADEMGLGKTVQIVGYVCKLMEDGARPFLIVVPNSTIGNWVREFDRFAPGIRTVPYGGDGGSRKLIEKYELFNGKGQLKTHVVLVTYEALEKNICVFKKVARWDSLIVDEGQRLKGGESGLVFKALKQLTIGHRIILSGTPIQNNVLELFNLLGFLDPAAVPNPRAMAEKYAELTKTGVDEIRALLKPHILRRTKNLVLDLPQLVEIVLPCTMTTLQREVYRSILARNASAIHSIAASAVGKSTSNRLQPTKKSKANFNNILLELRKCLGHPYLNNQDMEAQELSDHESHTRLVAGSAKLVLLEKLLPALKSKGHRVLIFSQFKITLNILESFLYGMKLKYLRLDGDTATLDRQRGIDAFNEPESDYFVYLLSTRAGGVGINLTTADTVILYDQDFNPQQDLQAIARSHRIGQKKSVRVFKLLVKDSCEEKILQACQKKLGLDHLIIQKMTDQDPTEDIESILQYGAESVFKDDADAEKNAIKYSDKDIDELIKKSSEPVQKAEGSEAGATFAEAQIWRKETGDTEAVTTAADSVGDGADGAETAANLHDFWANVLAEQQTKEREAKLREAANAGRGKRRRNEAISYAENPTKAQKVAPSSPINVSDDDDEFRPPSDASKSAEELVSPATLTADEGPGGLHRQLHQIGGLAVTESAVPVPGPPRPKQQQQQQQQRQPAPSSSVQPAAIGLAELSQRRDIAAWVQARQPQPKTQAEIDAVMRVVWQSKQRIEAIDFLLTTARLLDSREVIERLERAKLLPRREQTRTLNECVAALQGILDLDQGFNRQQQQQQPRPQPQPRPSSPPGQQQQQQQQQQQRRPQPQPRASFPPGQHGSQQVNYHPYQPPRQTAARRRQSAQPAPAASLVVPWSHPQALVPAWAQTGRGDQQLQPRQTQAGEQFFPTPGPSREIATPIRSTTSPPMAANGAAVASSSVAPHAQPRLKMSPTQQPASFPNGHAHATTLGGGSSTGKTSPTRAGNSSSAPRPRLSAVDSVERNGKKIDVFELEDSD